MASIEERYEESSETGSLPVRKYDVRDRFMLMPEKKRLLEKEAARRVRERQIRMQERKVISLTLIGKPISATIFSQAALCWPEKMITVGSMDRLNDDCLLVVMQQIRDLRDLWRLMLVSSRCRSIWEAVQRSVLVGIQKDNFPEYLEMFGSIGAQSDEQVHNLRCAIASESYRRTNNGDSCDPEKTFLLRHRETDVPLFERCFLGYLQHLDDFFNNQVERLHEMGVLSRSSHRITKHALLTLWRIGLGRPLAKFVFEPAYDVESIGRLLMDQAQEVRIRMRDIIHILSCRKEYGIGCMSALGEHWIDVQEQYLEATGKLHLQLDDHREWMDGAINATVMMLILVRGTDDVIHSERDTIEEGNVAWINDICGSRSTFEETGAEDEFLISLKGHMKVAQQLGVNSLDVSRGLEKL